MSLGIVIKGPEGLVLAADSRVTLAAQTPQGMIPVTFDNATKLLNFQAPYLNIGVVTYGLAAIQLRTARSFVPEFESKLKQKSKEVKLSVLKFAEVLGNFFLEQWQAMPQLPTQPPNTPVPVMTFVVAGYDENEPYGDVYVIDIPTNPTPKRQHPDSKSFGLTWGGQREIVDRLMRGYDPRILGIAQKQLNLTPDSVAAFSQALNTINMPIPIQLLSLQDCIDLAIFFIRTTIEAQRLTIGLRGVGGEIDLAVITGTEGFNFIQRKELRGQIHS
jgi:hypothetical protein